jgi:hypothetical protein
MGVTQAMGRVSEFNMTGSDDAASSQHAQRGSFLFVARSAQREVVHQRREDVHVSSFVY